MFEEFIQEVHSVVVGCTRDLEENTLGLYSNNRLKVLLKLCSTMCMNDIPRELTPCHSYELLAT